MIWFILTMLLAFSNSQALYHNQLHNIVYTPLYYHHPTVMNAYRQQVQQWQQLQQIYRRQQILNQHAFIQLFEDPDDSKEDPYSSYFKMDEFGNKIPDGHTPHHTLRFDRSGYGMGSTQQDYDQVKTFLTGLPMNTVGANYVIPCDSYPYCGHGYIPPPPPNIPSPWSITAPQPNPYYPNLGVGNTDPKAYLKARYEAEKASEVGDSKINSNYDPLADIDLSLNPKNMEEVNESQSPLSTGNLELFRQHINQHLPQKLKSTGQRKN